MDSVCNLSYVSARFMQLTGPGVYMPRYVTVSVSEDGNTFVEVARIENDVPADRKELVIKDFTARFAAVGVMSGFMPNGKRVFNLQMKL